MFGPGEEFLGAQSTTIFFFFLINGSSKESKPSEAHPRIFFLSLLLLPMTCVNPIELFFTGSFFFFSSSKSPCGNFDYLTGLFAWIDVVEFGSSVKKFDCDNCSQRRTRKTKRVCWQVWSSLRWHDGSQRWWERTFHWIFQFLSFRWFAWNPEMQSLSFPKKLFVGPKTVSTTLYLFFRSWWQIFVLLKRT